ncbi:DUF695 domain-containing protein [Phenylobacterium sp.]|uniref:DUF695 domain-containing protein n=1 Tax=Phenylobacterium sp. TaxID=1871053 RepID=UPI002ED80242
MSPAKAAAFLAAGVLALGATAALAAPGVRGPDKGTLIIAGGGKLGREIVGRFITLAGGPGARIVVVPTAAEQDFGQDCPCLGMFRALGATNLTVLHTRDPKVADTEAFAAPLRTASAVWFVGGRHWRLVDSYAGTRTEAEIKKLLARGGVVGGTSAGASIQASYLVRGAREGNEVMMAPGYEKGFGLMQGVAIDQHITARGRENHLKTVIDKHPDLLGIGIDQSTAIEVTRDRFKVLGVGHVFIHDGKKQPNGGFYSLLRPGEAFDLKGLKAMAADKPAASTGCAAAAAALAQSTDDDEWNFYPLKVDNQPASIFLDMSIARRAPVPGYDRMGYLRVIMRKPRDDGLSSSEEFDELVRVEDAIVAEIQQASPTLYVGRNTSSGNRDFYFYTRDAQVFEAVARRAMAAFPEYRFEIGDRADAKWSTYFEFLYPRPLDIQFMGNRSVLARLATDGDDGAMPRSIDHLAIFPNRAAGDGFATEMAAQGFKVEAKRYNPDDRKQYLVNVSRVDRPVEIDRVVEILFNSAQKRGGEYDGWETEVVRGAK